jgi:hypothetical protein
MSNLIKKRFLKLKSAKCAFAVIERPEIEHGLIEIVLAGIDKKLFPNLMQACDSVS